MRALWLALALSACASAGPEGWTRSERAAAPFSNTQARCQIETQVVSGSAFETCMAAHGWDRASRSHAGGYNIVGTTLTVDSDVAVRTIRGTQATTIVAEVDLTQLRFDANALVLDEIRVDGVAATVRADTDGVFLALPRRYRAGERFELQLRYHGAPARGLTFEEGGSFYTSYFSCDWMFCELDRPGDKFRFIVSARTVGGLRYAVYNSDSESNEYPAYLQGFAGGQATEVRQRVGDVTLIYASGHASEADLNALFASTPAMLEFFQRRAGVPFPHPRFVQILVQADEAQEGAGIAVLGDGVVRPMLENPREDWAIAHELAHTYWGNLVTCRDWTHFWLNEGMTTFMVAAWKQERWGEADYQREIEIARTRWARARDAGWDRPLAFAGPYPDLRTRRAIQYSKGMLFMVELRGQLGEGAFWRGIAAYTRAHAGGVVESADLQAAMEATSGRDLQALFDEWVYPAR
ncbi:MAG: M1 family peptidase [Caulobacteraceae bacterium]|nr:M1 family peptidase [Caulobacteraceae bacterium]